MNVKKNDTVIVLSGKDKGKKGKVLEAMPAAGKVVVEGVNVATCHVKPKKQGDQGGIVSREIPMYVSKVMLVCPKCKKGVRVGYSVLDIVHAFSRVNHVDVPYVIAPRRAGDIDACYADPSKAEALLHWKATKTLDDMCRDSWRWQTQNPNGYQE